MNSRTIARNNMIRVALEAGKKVAIISLRGTIVAKLGNGVCEVEFSSDTRAHNLSMAFFTGVWRDEWSEIEERQLIDLSKQRERSLW